MRDGEHQPETAVWEECPRCLIPFALDATAGGDFYLVCPCCRMTRALA